MISTNEITIVFQGAIKSYKDGTGESFSHFANMTRIALPNCKIILSTWEGTEIPNDAALDLVVTSKDPGGLPGVKFDDKINNINRQIVTTKAGLDAVETPYAIKMRTDCQLEHAGFLEYFKNINEASPNGEDRIISTGFFTIDPTIFEHIPFHVSDWFQFGKTEVLRSYWDLPLMSLDDATYYERHKFSRNSGYLDKKFRVRLAVEQYISIHYAKRFGYSVPQFHNDAPDHILSGYEDFLARHFIILDPWQAGLCFPKYFWAYSSRFQSINCIMFLDWYRLFVEKFSPKVVDDVLMRLSAERLRQKARARRGAKLIEPFGFIWYSYRFKKYAAKVLKFVTR